MATLTDPPRRVAPKLEPMTRDDAHALLEGVKGERLEALYVIALHTWLRQGKLLALRWQDIDLVRVSSPSGIACNG